MIINGGVYFKCRDASRWRITRQSLRRWVGESAIFRDDLCRIKLASSHHPQLVIESSEAITLYLQGSSFRQDNNRITSAVHDHFAKVFRAMALCKKRNTDLFKTDVIL